MTDQPRATKQPFAADIRRYWSHYHDYQRAVLAAGAVTGMAAAAELLMLAALASITIAVEGTGAPVPKMPGIPSGIPISALLGAAATLVLIRFALGLCGVYLASALGARYELEKRAAFIDSYLQASWPAQAAQRGQEAQDIVTTAIMFGRTGLKSVATSVGSAFSMAIMLVGALAMSWVATLFAIMLSLVLALGLQPLVRRSKVMGQETRDSALQYVSAFGETVNLSREIRLAGVANRFRGRLSQIGDLIQRQRKREQFLLGATPQIFETGVFLIVLAGFAALHYGNVGSSAQFIAMLLLLLRASQYGRALQSAYHQAKASEPYLELIDQRELGLRLNHVRRGTTKVSTFSTIELQDLCYSYDDRSNALTDVSIRINKGDVIGVIGPSGSGKSTLVDLLLGLRRPTEGAYLVDGRPQHELDPESWYRLTGLVTQEPQLIEGNVRENIHFFRDYVSEEDISAAVEASGLGRDVNSLQDGLDTRIGPRSSGLSGGQRQRLSIARVLAGRPELLVLDEPTSALDVHAEAVVTDTLERLKSTTTIVVVAHRLSTLRVCDKVAIVRDGSLEAFGDRKELEQRSSYYASAVDLAHLS